MSKHEPTIELIQKLYDDNLFLDAYQLTEELWHGKANVAELNSEELILGARLANRLGNSKYWRWLLREAKKRFPDDPKVNYFYNFADHKNDFFKDLVSEVPQCEDAALMGSHYAGKALTWAAVRDWEFAEKYINEAKAFNSERDWIKTCEAHIALIKDNWQEAEEQAKTVWQENPGMPFTASVINSSLTIQSKLEEAAEFFFECLDSIQSYEVVLTIIRQCFVNSERFIQKQEFWLERAEQLIDKLPMYAPLADRHTQKLFKYFEVELAFIRKDRKKLQELSRGLKDPFFKKILENCEKNPAGKEYVLPLNPVFQKHDTCLITSMFSVLSTMGEDIPEATIQKELFFGGANMEKCCQWLSKQGYKTSHVLLDREVIVQMLKEGIPLIMSSYNDSFSHATVIFGYDEVTDLLLVHDPSKSRWSRYLLEEYLESESPTGPNAMIIVKAEKENILQQIPEVKITPLAYKEKYWQVFEKEGASGAYELIKKLESEFPDEAITAYLQASHLSQIGEHQKSLPKFQKLVEEYPKNKEVRNLYLFALSKSGDKQLYKSELVKIIDKTRDEGFSFDNQWYYAPPTLISQYCDLINISAPLREDAKKLLKKHIKFNPMSCELYHMLGDIYGSLEQYEKSLIPLRVASTLEITNSHYARALCNNYRLLCQEEKALEYMKNRRDNFSDLKLAVSVFIDYIDLLDDYGYPQKALAAVEEMLEKFSEDAEALSYAAGFFIKLSQWQRVEELLTALKSHKIPYFQSAYRFYRATGEWRKAKEICSNWLNEAPDNLFLKEEYLELLTYEHGYTHARGVLEEWLAENSSSNQYQLMMYRFLKKTQKNEEADALIDKRLAENPDSEWDWLEKVHNLLNDLESANEQERKDIESKLETVLPEVERTTGECPAGFAVKARVLQHKREYLEATELYLKAVEKDPDYSYIYNPLWECTKQLQEKVAHRFQNASIKCMLRQVGFLNSASSILYKISRTRDFYQAEESFKEWSQIRQNDPELIDAYANLLIDHGKGQKDAEKAVEFLKNGIENFPWHLGLKESLLRALKASHTEDETPEVLQAICDQNPLDTYHHVQLANHMSSEGKTAEAQKIFQNIIEKVPLSGPTRNDYAEFLWEQGNAEGAIDFLKASLDFMPESISIREELIMRLFSNGQDQEAVKCAKDGTEVYQNGSYLWYLYAKAMRVSRYHLDMNDTIKLYNKVLEMNPNLFDAAEDLIFLFCDQKNFDKAKELVEEQIKIQSDPTCCYGLKAYIFIEEGKKEEALQLFKTTLIKNPRYEWGWRHLFGLLNENTPKSKIEEILKDWPVKNLIDLPEIRTKRLFLLHEAGIKSEELDNEWDELLKDFPTLPDIHLRRFDILENDSPDKAKAILQNILSHHPDDAFILARYIPYAYDESEQKAFDIAFKVWQQYKIESSWPAGNVWEFLKEKKLENKANKMLEEKVFSLTRLHKLPFYKFIDYYLEKHSRKSTKTLKSKSQELIQLLKDASWSNSYEKEEFFRTLKSFNVELTIKLLEEHNELYKNDTKIWQQYMNCLLCTDNTKARSQLSKWRTKPDVDMFIVENYNLSLFRDLGSNKHDQICYREVKQSSLDALNNLNHDYTVRAIVSDLLEACLQLGDYEEFVEHYMHYITYMECDEPDDYYCSDEHSFRYPAFKGFFNILTTGNSNQHMFAQMKKTVKEGFKLLEAENVGKLRKLYRNVLKAAGIPHAGWTAFWASVRLF
ncbi:MAG: C39 family peptidase [Lentisphaerales bacterium]|nr:C39 family peptidase [Lentisphaerales bacterium]